MGVFFEEEKGELLLLVFSHKLRLKVAARWAKSLL